MSPLDPEVPEADAFEQAQDVVPEASGAVTPVAPAFEVPEADALDQAREVPDDEDWR